MPPSAVLKSCSEWMKKSFRRYRLGLMGLMLIQRAADAYPTFVKNMGVDHGCFDIFVAEKFLHCTDIVAGFEQMGCKTVTQCI